MDRNQMIMILKCIGDKTVDKLPELLEQIPGIGKTLSLFSKAITEGIGDYNELKKKSEEELKEKIKESTPPDLMDWVMFTPQSGQSLTQQQQEELADIFSCEFESDDEASLGIINEFIGWYMGGHIDVDDIDEFGVAEGYCYLNFNPDDEHTYNDEDMKELMDALNKLIGTEVFEEYVIQGRMQESDDM